jgi:sulfate adenylyltransferase subunit 2
MNRETKRSSESYSLSVIHQLEAEAIHVIREVAATFERPVILYSVGKDSAVLLHLVRKAFHPAPVPFPLMHIDTTWKFPEMYAFRDRVAEDVGMRLIVETNEEAKARGANPFTWGSVEYTNVMKTQALLGALKRHRFDAAFGGGRRDEERSRAKERIFSFRDANGSWDPKNQRPEVWDLFNTRIHRGESIRVFPLSNWTELDVWQYILLEKIPICDLYVARTRGVVRRDGLLLPWYTAEDRATYSQPMELGPGEEVEELSVRYRTLGCWPLTAATESTASNVEEVVAETMIARKSERSTRVIDHDQEASMETKKREGYF